jgi:hypothetical protein
VCHLKAKVPASWCAGVKVYSVNNSAYLGILVSNDMGEVLSKPMEATGGTP